VSETSGTAAVMTSALEPETTIGWSVSVTADERARERLSPANARAAVQALTTHGFVILENSIDPAHLDVLREKMMSDSRLLLRGAKVAPALFWSANGRRHGHLQQSVPRSADYVFRDIHANPLAAEVTRAILGDGAWSSFPSYCCNVNCPGSADQDVHFDPAPRATLVVNIALRDVTEADGAIELWPGSHLEPGMDNPIPEVDLQRRRELLGGRPIRGATKKGSLVIRDLRLWHRGRSNPSNELRHMLNALHYTAAAAEDPQCWAKERTVFDRACEPIFRGTLVRPHVSFSDRPTRHLLVGPKVELASAISSHPWTLRAKRMRQRVKNLVAR
jgi:hypothetical protein